MLFYYLLILQNFGPQRQQELPPGDLGAALEELRECDSDELGGGYVLEPHEKMLGVEAGSVPGDPLELGVVAVVEDVLEDFDLSGELDHGHELAGQSGFTFHNNNI